jgi:geranylgeranyl diphosphate synthase type II
MIKVWSSNVKFLENEIKNLRISGSPKELYEPISYILSLGGKRIRPALCLLATELFQGDIEDSKFAALSVEVFHNFTLVHDDIMDEAPIRRGQSTVHEKWNRDIAILSGDVMFVKAYELLSELNEKHLPSVFKLFNQTAIEVCEGQQMDMNFETAENVSIDEYLKMIELKTSVLLACSLKMGALISNSSIEDANLIYEFGRNLGIAFQIQDDFLDAYGDPEKFGKRVGGDIISNKKTYLLLTAFEKANSSQKESLKNLLNLVDFEEENKVEAVKAIYNEIDIPSLTEIAIQSYFELAMKSLESIQVEESRKEPLRTLAQEIMQRKN